MSYDVQFDIGFARCKLCEPLAPPWRRPMIGPLMAHGCCSNMCFQLYVIDEINMNRVGQHMTNRNFNFINDWISETQTDLRNQVNMICELRTQVDDLLGQNRALRVHVDNLEERILASNLEERILARIRRLEQQEATTDGIKHRRIG